MCIIVINENDARLSLFQQPKAIKKGVVIAVVKYDQPKRSSPYGVKWTVDGKRKFKFFKTDEERNKFFKKLVVKEKKLGEALLLSLK